MTAQLFRNSCLIIRQLRQPWFLFLKRRQLRTIHFEIISRYIFLFRGDIWVSFGLPLLLFSQISCLSPSTVPRWFRIYFSIFLKELLHSLFHFSCRLCSAIANLYTTRYVLFFLLNLSFRFLSKVFIKWKHLIWVFNSLKKSAPWFLYLLKVVRFGHRYWHNGSIQAAALFCSLILFGDR